MLEKEWRDYFIKVYVGIGIVVLSPLAVYVMRRFGLDKDTILAAFMSFFTVVAVVWYARNYVAPFFPWNFRTKSETAQSVSSVQSEALSPEATGQPKSFNRHNRSWTGFTIVGVFSFARLFYRFLGGTINYPPDFDVSWIELTARFASEAAFAGMIPLLWMLLPKFSKVGVFYGVFSLIEVLAVTQKCLALRGVVGKGITSGVLDERAHAIWSGVLLREGWPIIVFWGPILLCWAFYALRDRKSPAAAENDA